MGERLSWDELASVLFLLAVWAVAITVFTESIFQAIERKRQDLDDKEYWRSLWRFPEG